MDDAPATAKDALLKGRSIARPRCSSATPMVSGDSHLPKYYQTFRPERSPSPVSRHSTSSLPDYDHFFSSAKTPPLPSPVTATPVTVVSPPPTAPPFYFPKRRDFAAKLTVDTMRRVRDSTCWDQRRDLREWLGTLKSFRPPVNPTSAWSRRDLELYRSLSPLRPSTPDRATSSRMVCPVAPGAGHPMATFGPHLKTVASTRWITPWRGDSSPITWVPSPAQGRGTIIPQCLFTGTEKGQSSDGTRAPRGPSPGQTARATQGCKAKTASRTTQAIYSKARCPPRFESNIVSGKNLGATPFT
jgi:hypothetical protein